MKDQDTSGAVFLIGAGPGSPDLLTLRGLHLLRHADLIIMDTILPDTFLDELSVLGKQVLRPESDPADSEARQQEINRWMIDAAGSGKKVARLKGGDPFLFGRGWEEIALLDKHGIAWEGVPGISSAMAVPASASLPLTTRHTARSVAFVTARLAGGSANREMPKADTIVIMMGMKVLSTLAKRLMDEGWDPDTPVCVIERGYQPGERQVKAPLAKIDAVVKQAGLRPPGIVVVGAGAGCQELQNPRPRILFSGFDPGPLRPLGRILHWPVHVRVSRSISQEEVETALGHFAASGPRAVVFIEPAVVNHFLRHISTLGRDARIFAGAVLVAGSATTASALLELNLLADRICREPEAGTIVTTLECGDRLGIHVLVVAGVQSPPGLEAALEAAGAKVEIFQLFDLRPSPTLGKPLPDHDIVSFGSPQDALAFHKTYGPGGFRRPIWCLTEAAAVQLDELGIKATIVVPPGIGAQRVSGAVTRPHPSD